MKKALALCLMLVLAVSFSACGRTDEPTDASGPVRTDPVSDGTLEGGPGAGAGTDPGLPSGAGEERKMKIQVTDGTHTVLFELNGSPAAKSLYVQLPLTTDVENYSDDEKIFYPEKLDTGGAVGADAKKGTLAYFSPWGDVVMYYKDFGSYTGLYELGRAISGSDEIEALSGTIEITAVE